MCGFLLVVIAGATATEALALGADFNKDQIAAAGKHCVHGYWLNAQTVVFYAGDGAQLNRDLPKHLVGGDFASRKVVIHVGTKRAESPWDTKARDTFADWSVNTDYRRDGANAARRMHMQIDIWLGSNIRLEDLRIPDGFEVVSGGEIEKFIEKRMQESKRHSHHEH